MLQVSRGKRFLGSFINAITFNFLIIGNFVLMLTSGKTLGGLAMGYKYEQAGFIALIKVWAGLIVSFLLYGITFSIFFWVDLGMMGKRNGWSWEKWFDIRKKSSR